MIDNTLRIGYVVKRDTTIPIIEGLHKQLDDLEALVRKAVVLKNRDKLEYVVNGACGDYYLSITLPNDTNSIENNLRRVLNWMGQQPSYVYSLHRSYYDTVDTVLREYGWKIRAGIIRPVVASSYEVCGINDPTYSPEQYQQMKRNLVIRLVAPCLGLVVVIGGLYLGLAFRGCDCGSKNSDNQTQGEYNTTTSSPNR